jgi:protein-S-isoprenylcysteine O-methyltransferase Ste14
MKLNYATLVLATIAVGAFEARFCTPPWTPLRIVALLVAGLSFGLLVLARLQLGAAFSVQARAKTLVTTGLYSRIRNPIYVFSTLFLAGLVVFDRAPLLLFGLLILIPVQAYRAQNEQKLLAQKFGPAYIAYKQQTWF